MATKNERIEIDIPEDVVFAMRGEEKPEGIKKKLKAALAILLFQEKSISLGKAAELAELSRLKFMEVLKEHGVPAYEYDEKDFEKDRKAIVECREVIRK